MLPPVFAVPKHLGGRTGTKFYILTNAKRPTGVSRRPSVLNESAGLMLSA